jgi:hypothetical protein
MVDYYAARLPDNLMGEGSMSFTGYGRFWIRLWAVKPPYPATDAPSLPQPFVGRLERQNLNAKEYAV